eukprot:5387215-Pyramimonas_sp.AAC.1
MAHWTSYVFKEGRANEIRERLGFTKAATNETQRMALILGGGGQNTRWRGLKITTGALAAT